MGFFLSGFFWFIEGILVCLTVIGIRVWAKDHAVDMPLLKWGALAVWFVLVGFSIAFIGTCIGENEMIAALRGGLLLGFLSLASGVVLWRYIMCSFRKNVK